MMDVHLLLIDDVIARALREDIGHGHDITAAALIPADRKGWAVMRARRAGTMAGAAMAARAFELCDPSLNADLHVADGTVLELGQDILTVTGPARSILTAERTALNLACHLSGIATQTAHYVAAVQGTKARIVCTRKTLPGLRALQKYAVRVGGGFNHRFGLDDGLLIKDNHIALAGGVAAALKAARQNTGHMVKVEIEVDTLAQLEEALAHGADIVLLDNMSPADLKRAVAMAQGKALTEASGGITLDTVRAVADAGVDIISVGALTHSVTALDLGLDIDL
jgi:nicotinate-nucleotide pyrophosphorylase (carboxylating)